MCVGVTGEEGCRYILNSKNGLDFMSRPLWCMIEIPKVKEKEEGKKEMGGKKKKVSP